jgi:hypothetical protein
MIFSVWMLVLAVFLSGAVAGVFVMLLIGIRIGDRSPNDGHRASHELVEGPGSSTIQRQVRDGRRFRAVKVALEPRSLERSLRELAG